MGRLPFPREKGGGINGKEEKVEGKDWTERRKDGETVIWLEKILINKNKFKKLKKKQKLSTGGHWKNQYY